MSGANTATPALFTSASSRPKPVLSFAIAAVTAPESETSQCRAIVAPGYASAATAPCSNSRSMSSSATRQPSARNRFATASPMPRAAPVTSATFCGEGVIDSPMAKAGFQLLLARGAVILKSKRSTALSMRLLRSSLLDLSGRRPVLDGADDCGENSTGHAATGHLADDAADIRCRGAIGEQRNQHTEELSPGAAADR